MENKNQFPSSKELVFCLSSLPIKQPRPCVLCDDVQQVRDDRFSLTYVYGNHALFDAYVCLVDKYVSKFTPPNKKLCVLSTSALFSKYLDIPCNNKAVCVICQVNFLFCRKNGIIVMICHFENEMICRSFGQFHSTVK